ncbi:hypothetical protein EW026_g2342 [Hermanssonia centrifuga]|uniref:Uncharacterized protein n=1 Tax=Hermanssonia centrifuga TaxID=98765 RepID=A0A4S4KNM2_9APHY|nr:hypothetical protein EW026_g2342 [Hermanssonia centrifuga]
MSDPTDNAQITEELQILQIEIFFIWSATGQLYIHLICCS